MPTAASTRLLATAPLDAEGNDFPADIVTLIAQLEARAAGALSGLYAARPAAAASNARFLYDATDARALFYSDGAAWTLVAEIRSMTTVQRDALVAGGQIVGRVIYNTDTAQHEKWTGAAWKALSVLSIPWHAEWALANPGVPSAATNFVDPLSIWVPTNWTRTITQLVHGVRGGTSVAFDMRKAASISGVSAGTTLTGMTSLTSTTSTIGTPVNPTAYTLADGDLIAPVPSTVTGSPDNWIVRVSGLLTYTG